MSNWIKVLDQPRGLTQFEKSAITKMISFLPDKEILYTQMMHAEVISVCDCGCRTADLIVPSYLEKYVCNRRVPVEMLVSLVGELAPVLFQLHIVDGYLIELEILKLDSSPIHEEIDICKGVVEVRV